MSTSGPFISVGHISKLADLSGEGAGNGHAEDKHKQKEGNLKMQVCNTVTVASGRNAAAKRKNQVQEQ